MQYIVIAPDKPDNLEKRLAARKNHIALGDTQQAQGNHLYGVALIDKNGDMCRSVILYTLPVCVKRLKKQVHAIVSNR
jgi:hypothetical protein